MYEGEKEEREERSVYIWSEALLPVSLLSKVERYSFGGQVRARLETGRRPAATCLRGSRITYECDRKSKMCLDIRYTNKSE